MRLFLAIDLPKKVKTELEKQITPLKKEYPQFDWISEKNYHITIHFFGEIEDVEKLQKRLEECLYDQESFYLYSFGANLFINNKIVPYISFRREKKLESIAMRVNPVTLEYSGYGVKEEKKYIPHLTLARSKIPSKQQYFVLKKRMRRMKIDISFQVKKLVLFQSILGGKYPEYKIVKRISLL